MTRVFVLADSQTAAEDLAELLAEDERLEVSGACSLSEFDSHMPEEVNADVVLASCVAEAVLSRLGRPVVLLSKDRVHEWPLDGAIKAQLSIHCSPAEAIAALIAAAQGLVVLTTAQAEEIAPAISPPVAPSDALVEHLTARETQVLRMMANGAANKEIAEKLQISENTVKFHVASIFGKTGAGSRTEAVTRGIRLGLIPI